MQNTQILAGFALVHITLLGACGNNALEPTDDPEVNFDVLWNDFDRRYSFFILKGIDWDASYQRFRPQINVGPNPVIQMRLARAMEQMLLELEDPHVWLQSVLGRSQYTGWFDRFPENFDSVVTRRGLRFDVLETNRSGRISYGIIAPDIGYIWIPSFGGEDWSGEIDAVLAGLGGIDAVVLDIRQNGGGSDRNQKGIAGRFADRRRLFRRIQVRDGPDHDDFTDPEDDFIEPLVDTPFLSPVAVLTNRRVLSAAESFVLAMRTLPHVITVGDTTGGGSANPEERTLPNGWAFAVSRWIEFTPDGATFEGVGLAPDFPTWITSEDRERGVDTILELARRS